MKMRSKIQNFKPLILSITLILLICIIAYARIQNQNIWEDSIANFDIIIVIIYLLWIVFESTISIKERDKGEKTSDFGTLEFYAISQALTFLSALWFESIWPSPGFAHFLGLDVFLFGICFRLWAIITLGHYYSHIVREVDDHKIIDSGPYKYIRHPAYVGMIVAHFGIVLYFCNLVTLLIFFLALIPAIILRIFIEEKTLFRIEGYSEYAKNLKRLIPLIW
jgi:protein-S-isoprenylcysteine O-methyltransferase Ste14